MSVEIRRVGPDDAALFEHVAKEVFDAAVHPDRLAEYLSQPDHLLIVALCEGKIAGQVAAVVHRHPDKHADLFVDEVAVTPQLQRTGVGRAMLSAMLTLGTSLGCMEAWVLTGPDNLPANGFYRRLAGRPMSVAMYEFKL